MVREADDSGGECDSGVPDKRVNDKNNQKILEQHRGKIIEIDLYRLKKNFEFIRSRTSSRIFAVLKASAYGHGIENIAPFISPDGWCVGTVQESEKIRHFSEKSILLLKGTHSQDEDDLIDRLGNIYVVIRDMYDLEKKIKGRKLKEDKLMKNRMIDDKKNTSTKFFIKVDTGMGRLGILPDEVDKALETIKRNKFSIDGIISHFAFSDISDKEFILEQIKLFKDLSNKIERELGKKLIKTLANSAGALRLPESHFDFVRPGISLYGVSPFGEGSNFGLQPILSVRARVIARKNIPRGWSVGYSRKFIAQKSVSVAVLGVGYSDGIPRLWWEKGYVFIPKTQEKAKIIGVISMDMMCVLSENLYPGDEVEILGDNVPIYEMARETGTIPYEILCSIGIHN